MDIIQHYKDNAKAQGRFLFLVHNEATDELTCEPEFWERLMWWWSTHADMDMCLRFLDPGWMDALSEEELVDAMAYATGRVDDVKQA